MRNARTGEKDIDRQMAVRIFGYAINIYQAKEEKK
jgi:hypothetical protein